MSVILPLSLVALVAGAVALVLTTRDFRSGRTFHATTAAAIYAGWTSHAAAYVASLLLDPYRLEFGVLAFALLSVLPTGVGVALFVLAISRFESFRQVTGTEVGGLVTSGPYRYSRNPQYTGWILLLIGAAIAARSPIAMALALAVVLAMRIWIPHEERHLEEEFGEEYRRYRERVPRFLGLSRGRPPGG